MKIQVLALSTVLLPAWSLAQNTPPPALNPAPAVPTITGAPAPASPAPFDPSLPAPVAAPPPALPAVPAPASAPTPAPAQNPSDAIRLNFQNASLADVLSYLSATAGFIILQEAPVTGTVNVVSAQPVTADEAVDLLNAVLVEKGYIAMRSGRILKIVTRQGAELRDLPVLTGSDPTQIPRKDNLVTQILPVRYADVTKLIDNISPLLPPTARITSNTSSNAIVLTDTQTDIHRVAEIIRALDTSISGISTIHVYALRFADAKSLAEVLTQLFATSAQAGQAGNTGFNFPFPFGGGRGGGGNGGGGGGRAAATPAAPESEARQAASRVVAVADDQSNSVIVSAPEEYLSTISDVVNKLDKPTSDVTETRLFPLKHADANEVATILETLYAAQSTSGTPTNNNQGQRGGNQGNQQRNFQGQPQGNQSTTQRSDRALAQAEVAIVADPRTNAVLVSASHDTMGQIETTIARLDSSNAKKQHVHVYTLEHADPDNLAAILKGMFTVDGSSGTANPQASLQRLTNRTTTGASSDVADTLNTNSSNSGGAR